MLVRFPSTKVQYLEVNLPFSHTLNHHGMLIIMINFYIPHIISHLYIIYPWMIFPSHPQQIAHHTEVTVGNNPCHYAETYLLVHGNCIPKFSASYSCKMPVALFTTYRYPPINYKIDVRHGTFTICGSYLERGTIGFSTSLSFRVPRFVVTPALCQFAKLQAVAVLNPLLQALRAIQRMRGQLCLQLFPEILRSAVGWKTIPTVGHHGWIWFDTMVGLCPGYFKTDWLYHASSATVFFKCYQLDLQVVQKLPKNANQVGELTKYSD